MQGFKSPIDSWVVKVVVGAHGAIRVGTHRATGAGIENTDENSNWSRLTVIIVTSTNHSWASKKYEEKLKKRILKKVLNLEWYWSNVLNVDLLYG